MPQTAPDSVSAIAAFRFAFVSDFVLQISSLECRHKLGYAQVLPPRRESILRRRTAQHPLRPYHTRLCLSVSNDVAIASDRAERDDARAGLRVRIRRSRSSWGSGRRCQPRGHSRNRERLRTSARWDSRARSCPRETYPGSGSRRRSSSRARQKQSSRRPFRRPRPLPAHTWLRSGDTRVRRVGQESACG